MHMKHHGDTLGHSVRRTTSEPPPRTTCKTHTSENRWPRSGPRWPRTAAAGLAAAALTLLLLAAPAGAKTTLVLDGVERPEPYQRYVDQARVPTPEMRVPLVLSAERCRGREACTNGTTIWLGDPFWQRYAVLHELGHVYDRHVLEDRHRHRFHALMRDWRPWDDAVEEVFADAYWSCSMNGRRPAVRTPLYAAPGRRGGVYQHRKVCRLIHQASRGR